MTVGSPLFSVCQGSKSFSGAMALNGVDLDLWPGEIHALIGENGAGKSTLCKAIAGAITLTDGSLKMNGEAVRFGAPAEALRSGVAMVYQESSLIPTMTVAENIVLGRERWFNAAYETGRIAKGALAQLGYNIAPDRIVETLSAAERQMVEIARAIYHKARVMIFDEPTASLSPAETDTLFRFLRRLKDEGVAIAFISHALEETLTISERVTVLRDGQRVFCGETASLTREDLVRYMVGRDLEEDEPNRAPLIGTALPVLEVKDVRQEPYLLGMTFSARAGEITGLAGLVGAGRTEIARVIAGITPNSSLTSGEILIDGQNVRFSKPRQAIRAGISYITEDRKVDGFFPSLGIDRNISAGARGRQGAPFRIASGSVEQKVAADWIDRLAIRALNRGTRVVDLSGGNQQKVVCAKSLVQSPRIAIFDEPTRGVDVGAIKEIHRTIRALRDSGVAVVVISSYLPEIIRLSDRIFVVRRGRISAELDGDGVTEEAIMQAASH